jgi:hypothetical protein
MEPVVRKIKVLEAKYVKEAESIIILGEGEEGKLRTQINKACFSFGRRTEEEIDYEMEKTAHLLVGKHINLAFDEELDAKIQCGNRLNYRI